MRRCCSPANGTLTINFKEAANVEAGKPYLVKWNNDNGQPSIANPVFTAVTISDASPNDKAVATNLVTFQGQYAPLAIDEDGDKTLLYIGADNKLFYPNGDATINAFHAWLKANINYGDVNNDGNVSVSDVTSLVNHILGNQDENFDVKNADLNGDGTISVNDVTTLVDIILHGSGILNVVVTGANGLTFGGVGNGPARISTYPHYE